MIIKEQQSMVYGTHCMILTSLKKAQHVKDKENLFKTLRLPTNNLWLLETLYLHHAIQRFQQVFVDVGTINKIRILLDVIAYIGGSCRNSTRSQWYFATPSQAVRLPNTQ